MTVSEAIETIKEMATALNISPNSKEGQALMIALRALYACMAGKTDG